MSYAEHRKIIGMRSLVRVERAQAVPTALGIVQERCLELGHHRRITVSLCEKFASNMEELMGITL